MLETPPLRPSPRLPWASASGTTKCGLPCPLQRERASQGDMELLVHAISSSSKWLTESIHRYILPLAWAGRQLRPLCAANTEVPLLLHSQEKASNICRDGLIVGTLQSNRVVRAFAVAARRRRCSSCLPHCNDRPVHKEEPCPLQGHSGSFHFRPIAAEHIGSQLLSYGRKTGHPIAITP